MLACCVLVMLNPLLLEKHTCQSPRLIMRLIRRLRNLSEVTLGAFSSGTLANTLNLGIMTVNGTAATSGMAVMLPVDGKVG